MSQESNSSQSSDDLHTGTPTLEEVQKYFLRQKRLANIKHLEATPPNGPDCLGETFQIYMDQRKQKLMKEKAEFQKFDSPKTSKFQALSKNFNDTTMMEVTEESWMHTSEDSFLEQERLCMEQSKPLIDLSSSSESLVEEEDKLIQDLLQEQKVKEEVEKKKFQLTQMNDMTMLENVEAPSFLMSNTTIMQSPGSNKHSPLITFGKRPSTITEEGTLIDSSASSAKNQTLESFRTAFTRNCSESSDNYKTAQEESYDSRKFVDTLPKPAARPFFDDDNGRPTGSFEADSLMSQNNPVKFENITADSLDENSTIEISSSSESSAINQDEEDMLDDTEEPNFNDTLEKFEYMMAQGMKLADKTPTNKVYVTPKATSPQTPDTIVKNKEVSAAKSLFPKTFTNVLSTNKQQIAKKVQPNPADFKKPQPTTKIPLPSHAKQFAHIVSPLSRYIKQTPTVPLATTAKLQRQSGAITKLYSSRESEVSFKENRNYNRSIYDEQHHVSSLPCRAKITTSNKQVIDHRNQLKIPAGHDMKKLLSVSPTVTHHEGRLKTYQPKVFKNIASQLNETQISEQSFGDLSLMSGDVSLHVMKDVQRL